MSAAEVMTLRTKAQGDGEHDMLYEYLTPIRQFLKRVDVTEIMINRPGEVWIETGAGFERSECPALTFDACLQIARLLANFNGKSIGPESPILSAAMLYGERVQVVVPPACESDTVSITIRKPSISDKTLDELETQGSFAQAEHLPSRADSTRAAGHPKKAETELLGLLAAQRFKDFLASAVRAKKTILIAGRTGSGKTTIAKSLVRCIAPHERLITIEDVHEMFLMHHKNKVHLFYSNDAKQEPRVTAAEALKSCMRMRPDRILLAELRGEEAWSFVKNVNSGHPGSISTIHANDAFATFTQLTSLVKETTEGAQIEVEHIRRMLLSTVDIVLFYQERKLLEIYYDPEFQRQQMV
jgi:type IV secretion system protein VirB11